MNDIKLNEDKIKTAYFRSREEGFEALYNEFYKAVYYFLLNMSSDPHLALDLTHEVFVKTYKEPGIENYKIKSWLFKVAANEFYGYKRSYYRKIKYYINNAFKLTFRDDEQADIETEFFQDIERASRITALRAALTALGEKDRTVITLKYYNGFSYEEIAETLGVEPGTVMSRLHRAKERLKEVMKNEIE